MKNKQKIYIRNQNLFKVNKRLNEPKTHHLSFFKNSQ